MVNNDFVVVDIVVIIDLLVVDIVVIIDSVVVDKVVIIDLVIIVFVTLCHRRSFSPAIVRITPLNPTSS